MTTLFSLQEGTEIMVLKEARRTLIRTLSNKQTKTEIFPNILIPEACLTPHHQFVGYIQNH